MKLLLIPLALLAFMAPAFAEEEPAVAPPATDTATPPGSDMTAPTEPAPAPEKKHKKVAHKKHKKNKKHKKH